jgi:hypothetical protein
VNNGNATLAPIACQSERFHRGAQRPELRHDRVSSPEDFNGWEEFETEQFRRTPEPINPESQGTEQDWLQWFNRTAMESLPSPILVAPAVLSKKVVPGTAEQRSKYVHDFTDTSNAHLTAAVRACRYKSVYAVWPMDRKPVQRCQPVSVSSV